MTGIKHRTFFVLFLIAFVNYALAAPPKKKSSYLMSLSPTLSFYSINTNHSRNPFPHLALDFGFKKEFRVGNEYKTSVLVGVDYFFQGLSFQSYYFKPDSIKIYDKSFGYTYSLFIHEIDLPVQFKYLFKREDNSLFSPYIALAYHLRYLLPGTLTVSENGQVVKRDALNLSFKNPLISHKLNAFVSLSAGWQMSNLHNSSKGSFFVEVNLKYGFSQYSFQTDYSASSLYINAVHLGLVLGVKF